MSSHLVFVITPLLLLSGCSIGNRVQTSIKQSKLQLLPIAPSASKPVAPQAPITISADNFAEDFSLNAVRAHDYYRNRIVRMTGVVERITARGTTEAEVVLRLNHTKHGHMEFDFRTSRAKLHKLQRGKRATLSGKYVAHPTSDFWLFNGLQVH